MSEINNKKDFEEILNGYISPMAKGRIVKGRVVKIGEQSVLVNIGSKTEGVIPITEFVKDGKVTIREGDEVEARVINISNALSQIKLSTIDLRQEKDLEYVKDALQNDKPVSVKVKEIANRGFAGYSGEINVYIPKSHIDMKGHIKEDTYYLDKILQCKVLKVDEENNSILASHRLYLESLEEKKRSEYFDKIKVGDLVKGKVKVLKKYGVFVDLGPVDAFLYKGNIIWGKVKDPTYYLEVDDVIEVKILNVDKASGKVEISLKHKTNDPWENVRNKYPEGSKIKGTVITKKSNGYILEIEDGID
jgi:ribosomal protein S1